MYSDDEVGVGFECQLGNWSETLFEEEQLGLESDIVVRHWNETL